MEIGKNIKYLRQQKNMTQDQLADYLGVSYQAVSKWETGANSPDIGLLPQIAKCFKVSLDNLFAENISDSLEDIAEQLGIEDDGVIRIVQMLGRKILKVDKRVKLNENPIEILFPRNCNAQTQYFKVEVFANVFCDSSINGDVVCHGNLSCHEINGDIVCHDSAECNRINGDIHADGNIEANTIHASQINCNRIEGCPRIVLEGKNN